jgi:hypothetical protein
VVSAGDDKYLKTWRIEEGIEMVSQVHLNEAIEKIVFVKHEDKMIIVAANGNLISLISIDEEYNLKVL